MLPLPTIALAACSGSGTTNASRSGSPNPPPAGETSPSPTRHVGLRATPTPSVVVERPTEVRRPIGVERPIAVEAPVALEPAAGCPPGSTPDEPGPADQARPPGRTGSLTFDRDSHLIEALIGLPRDEPALAQLRTFDVCDNTWSRMGAGIPLTNDDDSPGFVYDPGTDRVVLMRPRWVRTHDDALDAWTFGKAPTDPGGFGPEAFLDPATGRLVVLDDPGDLWS